MNIESKSRSKIIKMKKFMQRKAYDIISHKHGIAISLLTFGLIVMTSFYFGETVVEWSTEKYAAVFNSFSDNIGGRSFREKLCSPLPIDVVYTWVNGSDPKMFNQLRLVRAGMEVELNESHVAHAKECVFSNCFPTNMIVLDKPSVASLNMTAKNILSSPFLQIEHCSKSIDVVENYTMITFRNISCVDNILNKTKELSIRGHKFVIKQVYITTDGTVVKSMKSEKSLVMSGFPGSFSQDQLKSSLPSKYKNIRSIELFEDKGLALIHLTDRNELAELLKDNFTIESKQPTLSQAYYVWDLRDLSRNDDISASRFEDNEELRYSLRSVEQFAPWVRHIYIVTNGQIPHWLNIDTPRLTIITHEEIFPNKSHLPTFSSPSIESHIHRIPGLSDKFIYMNDDVIFGREVWPEDFFTDSQGQKVYLTWSIPNCHEGCPTTWIKDSYCDKACNNTECEWDGGDCSGDKASIQPGAGWDGGFHGFDSNEPNKLYCHSGCSNSWLADKYCDAACNVESCAFDIGDCGTGNYDKLHKLDLTQNMTEYSLPKGVDKFYFNLIPVYSSNGTITKAIYEGNDIIRATAVAQNNHVMTVILFAGHNSTKLEFRLQGHRHKGDEKIELHFNFTVSVDTSVTAISKTIIKSNETNSNISHINETEKTIPFKFEEIPANQKLPQAISVDPVNSYILPKNFTSTNYISLFNMELRSLSDLLSEGFLTISGFEKKRKSLISTIKKNSLKFDERKIIKIQSNNSFYYEYVINDTSSIGDGIKQAQDHVGRKLLSLIDSNHPMMKSGENVDVIDFHDGERLMMPNIVKDEIPVIINTHNVDSIQPWEKTYEVAQVRKLQDRIMRVNRYTDVQYKVRRTLDTFGESLKHVNKLYNKAFGYAARKVPGHMPHMIDKHVMNELQSRFPEEWKTTSSHKVRSPDDMQYSFSYFYYLMGVTQETTIENVFDAMDTDNSKVLSDREIRTLATKIYELPLDLPSLVRLEATLVNCSKQQNETTEVISSPPEIYYDKSMPQITRNLFVTCPEMKDILKDKFKAISKYKHVTMDDSDISFKMIKGNTSDVVGQLDDVRKNPKKFICLNDNIEHKNDERTRTVKAILQDFYEALFPTTSQFELNREYRNRFLYVSDLNEWKYYRDWLKFWTHIALAILVLFTIVSFFSEKIEAMQRRYKRYMRSTVKRSNTSDNGSDSSSATTDSDDSSSKGPSSIITL